MIASIAEQESEVTLWGNTGSDSLDNITTEVGVDTLTAVGRIGSREEALAILTYVVGCGADDIATVADNGETHSGIKYHHHARTIQGSLVQWSLPSDLGTNEGRIRVTVPGKVFAQMSERSQWRLCLGFHHHFKLRATRIDVRLDIYGAPGVLQVVHDAAEAGNYAGVKQHHLYLARVQTDTGVKPSGHSVYMGSMQSDKVLRIYDKNAESNGEKDCVRFELQARGLLAEEIMAKYAQIESDQFDELHQPFLIGVVLGAVDFVDRGSSDRYCRQKRLPWYQQLVDLAGARVRLSVPKKRLFIEEKIEWVDKQLACTLAQIREVRGVAWFNKWMRNLLHIGKGRLTKDHWALIDCAKKAYAYTEDRRQPNWRKGSGLLVAH